MHWIYTHFYTGLGFNLYTRTVLTLFKIYAHEYFNEHFTDIFSGNYGVIGDNAVFIKPFERNPEKS